MRNTSRPAASTLAGLGLITLLAVFLRFYKLNEIPPGLWFDEAWVSVQARNAIASQTFPLYLSTEFGGLHPAILYLTILARWLTQNNPLAVRFGVAAVNGLLIPVSYLALYAILQLSGDGKRPSQAIALGGAFILAVAFPMVLLSRVGFEVTLPALAGALLFACLALAWRTGQHRYDVLAGLALGASLYTYQSARLFPVAVVMAHGWEAMLARRWRPHFIALLLTGLTTSLVAAPLGLYFLRHPEELTTRAVTTTYHTLGPGATSIPLALLTNIAHTLLGLSWPGWGDQLMRHNWPGQPLFDLFISGLFWLGLFYLIFRSGQRTSIVLLTWAGVMLLPTVLTDNPPAFTRMAGALPALAGIGAVGGVVLHRILPRRVGLSVLLLGGVFSISFTSYQYFGRWANDPRLYDAFQLGDWNTAQAALRQSATAQVYLTPNLISPAHPTFDLLLAHTPVRAFAGQGCLVYPSASPEASVYAIAANSVDDQITRAQLETLYPDVDLTQATVPEPEGFPLYNLITIPAGVQPQIPNPDMPIEFGNRLQLAGHTSLPGLLHAGDSFTTTLYWHVRATLPADYSVFVHVILRDSSTPSPVAQHDAWPCAGSESTSHWQVGEGIVDPHPITLPADVSPGQYEVWVGLYEWASGERVPITSLTPPAPDRVHLGTIQVR